ncbi:hypothetical protein [Haladaptatus sp. DYF46]|uniref:hypothetical protein n=1 Tax=Haladaptatus sp. DYF46 TaxID=2886041 RepID=UPI001E4E44C2|nr:hypothetical protein [Haladaptatus sp. DYF46]
MNSVLVGVAGICFVAQLVMLYGRYIQDAPRISLVTGAGYALFWAYLAVTEFFELEFATVGLVVLLLILLPLTVVSVRRQRRDNRTRSA